MKYSILGLMSGTSMDGLDLCWCTLSFQENAWQYSILATKTLAYPDSWYKRLDHAIQLAPQHLDELDQDYGSYLAEAVLDFLPGDTSKNLIIASHGHTVHHRPEQGYTRQVGDPQVIANRTQRVTVGDFRSLDVSLGGQGAPLVPLADRLLFKEYACCVNLGGFANLSFELDGHRLAGDATVCNLLLNRLASRLGLSYDKGGVEASQGEVDEVLLQVLIDDPFYSRPMPKSLGREWFEGFVWPKIESYFQVAGLGIEQVRTVLATAVACITQVLATAVKQGPKGKILVTGGGAFNEYLISSLRQNLGPAYEVILPNAELINFKEALSFGLLGVLKLRGDTNTLASVTGAKRDSSGGRICYPGSE